MALFKQKPCVKGGEALVPPKEQGASIIQRFPRNTRGRDFVMGDMHGALSLVLDALREARFDPAVDRLFSTGDRIDRGPDSKGCIELPCHAVRGNHEDMLLDLYSAGEPDQAVIEFVTRRNGLDWWRDVATEDRKVILATIRALPLVIEIETERGRVGILHGEVPVGMTWQAFTAQIEAGNEAVVNSCLWGRERVKSNDVSGVPGIDRLFVGHSIHWEGPRQYGNVFVVDSGAVFGQRGSGRGHLTMAHVCVKTEALVAPKAHPALIDVRAELPPQVKPFGAYAASL